ncbi:unnamed protein product, partial [Discosporangium mesarthrocarpum]
LLYHLAERGYLCAAIRAPVYISENDPDGPSRVIAAYPEVGRWFVSGHSLGGSSAGSWAFDHYEEV